MGLNSYIGGKVKAAAKSLSSTFNPSYEEGVKRSQKVFGTDNPYAVSGAIVAGAAAAIAAPVAIAAGGGAKAVASAAGKALLKNPKIAGATLILGPAVTSAVVNNPTVVSKTVAGSINFEGNLIKAGSSGSLPELGQNLLNTAKENPVISGLVGGAAVVATGATAIGAASLISNVRNTQATKENTRVIAESITPMASASNQTGSMVTNSSPYTSSLSPILPQTTTMAKTSGTTRRRSAPAKTPNINFRVNIMNNNQSRITTKRYISGY